MEDYHMDNQGLYLEVKRSKDKVTRPISAVTQCTICRSGNYSFLKISLFFFYILCYNFIV